MDKNRFWKGFIVASSMLSLTFIPALTPAFAEDVVPQPQVTAGSYLTKEQFTEYNLWTNYINDYPNDAFGYINRGNIQYAAKDYKKAIEDYNQALTIDQYSADAYLKRGNGNFILGDKSRALLDYMSAVKIKPDMSEAYFNIGRVYYEQNDLDNALAYMSKGVAYNNERSDYFYELGRVQYKLGKYQDAFNSFTGSLSLDASNADAQFARGLAAINLSNYDAAAECFQNTLALNPTYPSASYYKGLALYQAGNFQDAVVAFDKAIEQAPEDGVAYNLRGCAKELAGDKTGAKKDYKVAKELGIATVGLTDVAKETFKKEAEAVANAQEKIANVNNIQSTYVWTDKPITPKERVILDEAARERLIREALKSGDIYGTVALLERIAENEPQNPEHYIDLAKTKLSIDSYTGVISDAETAIMNGSTNPEAYYLEGLAYQKKGNRIYAYRNFAMSYNADKQNTDYIYHLAEAAYSIGRYSEAFDLVSQLMDGCIEERFPEARLLRAKTEYKLGKYYSAVDDCNKYLKNNKKSSEAYMYSAFSKEALERYDEAIKDYTKAIRNDWGNADLHKYRGKLLLAQGHEMRAIYDFDKVVSIKGDKATSYDLLRVAELEEQAGNYENAIARYSQIIKNDDLNSATYIARASVYNKKGDVYNAIADYSTALRLNPYETSVYKDRGVLLVQNRAYRRGAEDLDKAIKMEPNNGLLYYYRAIANKALGRTSEAQRDYEKAKQFETL